MRLYHHKSAANHIVPDGHPERPERIKAVQDVLAKTCHDVPCFEAPLVTDAQLALVHDEGYLKHLFSLNVEDDFRALDGDTFLSPHSIEAARRGAGAACAAVDALLQGQDDRAFVAMRPPGHHAEPDKAMGFCFFSNAAIAARYAQTHYGVERVAVIDFDVHHGNGTQAAFWDRPDCFYASTHEMPLFPGTGHPSETGAGSVMNLPLQAGMDGQDFLQAWDLLIKQLTQAGPELVILSAGFDAHQADPLANINLKSDDFYEVTARLVALAETTAQGRVISLLEGGYDLQALQDSVHYHLLALQGLEKVAL